MTPQTADAAGRVAAGQLLDLRDGDPVEVAGDGVLQAARGDGEVESGRAGPAVEQAEDQAGRERVATTQAVDDVEDVVAPADVEAIRIPQAGRPAVDVGAAALA